MCAVGGFERAMGGAGEAAEGLDEEKGDGVVLAVDGVIVVAGLGGNPPDARGVVERAVDATATVAEAVHVASEGLFSVAEGEEVTDVVDSAGAAAVAGAGMADEGDRRRHLELANPVGAPPRGANLNEVGDVALVELRVLVTTLFVAEPHRRGGDGGKRLVPRGESGAERAVEGESRGGGA